MVGPQYTHTHARTSQLCWRWLCKLEDSFSTKYSFDCAGMMKKKFAWQALCDPLATKHFYYSILLLLVIYTSFLRIKTVCAWARAKSSHLCETIKYIRSQRRFVPVDSIFLTCLQKVLGRRSTRIVTKLIFGKIKFSWGQIACR